MMTFMGILEEVDIATDIGPALMWRWNSSEEEMPHVRSKVKRCQAIPIVFLRPDFLLHPGSELLLGNMCGHL